MNFYGRKIPAPGRVAGYGWLVSMLGLRVPMPRRLSLVSDHHERRSEQKWEIFRYQQWPGETVFDHLIFAIKNEGIDLRIMLRGSNLHRRTTNSACMVLSKKQETRGCLHRNEDKPEGPTVQVR